MKDDKELEDLRVELQVLHQKRSTVEIVDTEENELKESDCGDEPRWRPPHNLLPLLHHVKIVQQLELPEKKYAGKCGRRRKLTLTRDSSLEPS